MALFPFSISDIDDPECIRVVLYASGRMGHAPLNALLNQMRQDIERFNKQQSKDITQLMQRVDALEQQLKKILPNSEKAEPKQESQKSQRGKKEDISIIAGDFVGFHAPHISAGIASSGIKAHGSDFLTLSSFKAEKT
ncbi:hypothetical protein [Bartonella jaculi]|uniref:Uncharacterized protein n=1 Tax=Bartonella jaculi TaxID=686226 RepID=A0ABP9N593_9HYPH